MRPKVLLLIFTAAVCGMIASIGVSQMLTTPSAVTTDDRPKERIYVALREIDVGHKLDADAVRLEAWHQLNVPPGAIRRLEDLENKYTQQRFYPGEPILAAKLTDTPGTATVKIPEGFRVHPVKVSAESGGIGLITPGDHVDVLVFLRKNTDVAENLVHTLMHDVRVFSVGEATERFQEHERKLGTAQTVSLLLKPRQVEAVLLACEVGRIQLSLRRPDEAREPESAGDHDELAALQRLLQGTREATPSAPNTLIAAPTLPAATAQEEGWVMTVHTPEGVKILRWRRAGDLPTEEKIDKTSPSASGPVGSGTPTGPTVGDTIDITGTPLEGGPFAWERYRGRPVIVAFWATWSPLAREELLLARRLRDQYRDQGLELIGISVDDQLESVRGFVREHAADTLNLSGLTARDVATRYGVRQLPSLMLIDAEGRLVARGHRVAEIQTPVARQFAHPSGGTQVSSRVR